MKLRHKVFAAFFALGMIATTIAILSYRSFETMLQDFQAFAAASSRAQQELELARGVTEIQRQALIFTYEGHPGAAEQVQVLSQRMLASLANDHGLDDTYRESIRVHLETYLQTFAKLQKQRNLQYQLIHSDFPQAAMRAKQVFLRVHGTPEATLHVDAYHLQHEHVLNLLLEIENNAMRYFDSLDPQYIKKVKADFTRVRVMMMKKNKDFPVFDSQQMLLEYAYIDEFERIILEAVQRTRAYLFMVNVVMSAEAYEILYNVGRMSNRVAEEMKAIESSTYSTMRNVLRSTIISIAVSLLLVLLLSMLLSTSITRPVVRLTRAFTALSSGSSDTEIPEYGAKDEIGELTKAAIVFKEKNIQAHHLLTQEQRLTEKLAAKSIELEHSNEELEQFVYTVSHDLKSPIVTSMGFIGIVKKLAAQGRLNDAVSKLDRVVAANERMGQLVNDLLDLSRVGRVDSDKTMVDLNVLLQTFRKDQGVRLRQEGFTLQLAEHFPVIYGNPSRLLQLFENLLSNALKYAKNPAGSHVMIGAETRADGHFLYFKDNGPGIPEQYHEKVFALFYRLSNDNEGTGIGLTVAAKVMKFHQGSIWLESSPGEGATFWMRFNHDQEVQEDKHAAE